MSWVRQRLRLDPPNARCRASPVPVREPEILRITAMPCFVCILDDLRASYPKSLLGAITLFSLGPAREMGRFTASFEGVEKTTPAKGKRLANPWQGSPGRGR